MFPRISRRSVFDIWVANAKKTRTDAVISFVLEKLHESSLSNNAIAKVKAKVKDFCYKLEKRWIISHRHLKAFLITNASWIEGNINFSYIVFQASSEISKDSSSFEMGRPQKSFESCSAKSKKRRAKHLLESTSHEEVCVATEISLRSLGKKDSASLVRELSFSSPKRGTIMKRARDFHKQKRTCLTANQALALMIDAKLSRNQYNIIRQQVLHINRTLYPPYHKVKEAKQLCYPSDITITETSAEVQLQSLINHTVLRLCEAYKEADGIQFSQNGILEIILKWGCDGSEQNRYKQKFSDQSQTDESLFSISIVPLQIFSKINNVKQVIWQNPAPSSTRYCRPIKFIFEKETTKLIKSEVKKIEDQIATLSPTKITVNKVDVFVKPTLIFCMVDGKVCNALSSCISTQSCYLCGAKPTEMNNLDVVLKKDVNREFLSFGLSPLHSWIRFFECLLHISYRLEIKSWQARGEEKKNKIAQRKKRIQEEFKKQLGLLIDMPMRVSGNTNDGNTARKFFRNAKKSADITGLNVELIQRFRIILECLNCGFQINVDKFDEYIKQTRLLYLKEYDWYPMPVSVHKVLFHGRDIIASSILPIGQYSEEAQEARNKDNRKFRELFTRKTSRMETNTDLLHILLITSDPLIARLRAYPKTKHGQIISEVLAMLEEPSLGDTGFE